jgi:hypothetical protein
MITANGEFFRERERQVRVLLGVYQHLMIQGITPYAPSWEHESACVAGGLRGVGGASGVTIRRSGGARES